VCPVEPHAGPLARIPYGIAGGLTEHERRQLRRGNPSTAATARMDQVLTDGPPPGMTARERSGVGRMLLAAGRSTQQVAGDCGVCTRTVERWATTGPTSIGTSNTSTSGDTGEGSRGGHRAPLRISTAHHAQAGTRAPEGPRG
jgi:hypothetical protein